MTKPGVKTSGGLLRRESGEDRPVRDYTKIGEVSEPDFVRLPDPAILFARRAERLAVLAAGNPLGPYLTFLSGIAAVQHRAQAELPRPTLPPEAQLSARLAGKMPPLAREDVLDGDGFAGLLQWVAEHAAPEGAPEAAEQARTRLLAMPWAERLLLADAIFDGGYPAEYLGEGLYVAAALQVHLARLAAQLDAARLRPVGDGVCPACGNMPVASAIVGWASASRSRFCLCALCGTHWNYVRIKCTACGSTAGIAYFLIEEQSKDVAAETCAACQGYIKHFHQHRNTQIEPLADDIASFGLDVLVQEKNFRRTTINPFMVIV